MTRAMPRVSVILPAYNAELFVAAAVSSILGQSLADLELVAIDDGSTDATGRSLASNLHPQAAVGYPPPWSRRRLKPR